MVVSKADEKKLNNLSKSELRVQLLSSQSQLAKASETKSEVEQLTHNLQTHQIELEMQNRELIETQQKLEESRNRYADLYDFAPMGYLTLNRQGEIVEINLTGARMLGQERARLIEQPLTIWLAPQYAQRFFTHLRKVFSQSDKALADLKIRDQGGRTGMDIHFECAQVESEGESQCRCAMVDISERKALLNHLKAARVNAEQASSAKTQMLSRMSHEFRTPLNAILGFAQVLEVGDITPAQAVQLGHIMKAGWSILAMVEEMLDFTNIENKITELKIERVELTACVRNAMLTVESMAKERHIVVEQHLDDLCIAAVKADAIRLEQVLVYLLTDALKYNQAGDRIGITYQPFESSMRLAITDTGKGVPESDIVTMFEPFSPSYMANISVDGSGLGLAIAKMLVDEMGGEIGVTSKKDQGTTFWIELPRDDGRTF